jgi:hypothetical protein
MTNQNDAQTIARIEKLKGDFALNFKQICDLLTLLKSHHYYHDDRLFRHYREVSSGKLIPELVMALGLRRGYLQHMIGRPREVQMSVACDSDMSWCCALRGEIVEKRTSWKKMAAADFKRMFPIGGPVRSVQEQRDLLLAEMAAKPVTHIRQQPIARVDLKAGTFRLGAQVVPLSVVWAALAEVGIHLPVPMDGAAPQDCGPRVGAAAK